MKQIDMEIQVMTADFMAHHAPEVVRPVAAWCLIDELLSKVKGNSAEAASVELREWRTSHFEAHGIREPAFASALAHMRRVSVNTKALLDIDKINAL